MINRNCTNLSVGRAHDDNTTVSNRVFERESTGKVMSQGHSDSLLPEVGDIILYNEVIKAKNVGFCPRGIRGVGRVVEKTNRFLVVEKLVSETVKYRESIRLTDLASGLFVFRRLDDIFYCGGLSYEELDVKGKKFQKIFSCAC